MKMKKEIDVDVIRRWLNDENCGVRATAVPQAH